MAIVTGFYKTREDGVRLVKTYSDAGLYIERDGVVYGEAIDPEELGRVYTETDQLIETEESETEYGISEEAYNKIIDDYTLSLIEKGVL